MITILGSCVDPFDFTSAKQQGDFLVVNGFISNEDAVYQVTLQRSANFITNEAGYTGIIKDQGHISPETNAKVFIIEDSGRRLPLIESTSKSGVYKSPISGSWHGKTGHKYYLSITTRDGHEYLSQPEMITASPEIDSVYFRLEKHLRLDKNNVYDVWGIQYYANINFKDNTSFYWFSYDATYILDTPIDRIPLLLPPYPEFCYVSEVAKPGFNILENTNAFVKKQSAFKLDFAVPNFKYNKMYSYNLKQYSLTEKAYTFLKKLKNQIENSGTIFDAIPEKLIGNVYSKTNKNEIVIGYFAAYGVTSKRTFVSREDLPIHFEDGRLSECFVTCPPPIDNCLELYCFDCSKYPRSKTTKPSFWK